MKHSKEDMGLLLFGGPKSKKKKDWEEMDSEEDSEEEDSEEEEEGIDFMVSFIHSVKKGDAKSALESFKALMEHCNY